MNRFSIYFCIGCYNEDPSVLDLKMVGSQIFTLCNVCKHIDLNRIKMRIKEPPMVAKEDVAEKPPYEPDEDDYTQFGD